MRALHAEFLNDPSPTDVMAFDLSDGSRTAWQIVICVDVARQEARSRGITAAHELARYAIHGCLHNLGHDDHAPADRRRMRAAERYHLARLFAAAPATTRRSRR
jgi:probable rRNA maturation factor